MVFYKQQLLKNVRFHTTGNMTRYGHQENDAGAQERKASTAMTRAERRDFDARHRFADVLFAILIAASPLALGGTVPAASLGLFGALALLTLGSWSFHLKSGARWNWHWPVVGLALLAGWALLRATTITGPLGGELVSEGYRVWEGLRPRATLAPGHAATWAARTLSVALAAQYTAQRFSRSDRMRPLGLAVIGAGLVTAAVGLLQQLAGTHEVLFFYEPQQWSRMVPLAGPFVNPNQAGAIAGLSAVCALAAVPRVRHARDKALAFAAFVVLSAYTFAVGARGAALALAVALLAFLVLSAATQLAGHRMTRALALALPTTLLISACVLLYAVVPAHFPFEDGTLAAKTQIWQESTRALLALPFLGVGAGAFAYAFPTLSERPFHEWTIDPEAAPLQLIWEFGLLVSLAVLTATCLLLWRATRSQRTTAQHLSAGIGAIATFVALEGATGLGLHASAYLLAVGAVLGVAVGRAERGGTKKARSVADLLRSSFIILVVMGIAVGTPAALRFADAQTRVPLAEATADEAIDWWPRALAEAKLAPASPPLLLQSAALAVRDDDTARAHALLEAALRVAPYRREVLHQSIIISGALEDTNYTCELLARAQDINLALHARHLSALKQSGETWPDCLSERQLIGAAIPLLAESGDEANAWRLALSITNEGRSEESALVSAVWLATRDGLASLADPWVSELLASGLTQTRSVEVVARWARTTRNPSVASQAYEQAIALDGDEIAFRLGAARAAFELSQSAHNQATHEDQLERAAAHLDESSPRDANDIAERELLRGNVAWARDNKDEAAMHYRAALRSIDRGPDAVTMWIRIARVHIEAGELFDAQRALRSALELAPNNREARELLESIGG